MDEEVSTGVLIVKPAQSIVSRILCCFPPFLEANRQVSVSRIGTVAAVSSVAILFVFSAAEEKLSGDKPKGNRRG